jgi:hypothetical protein
MISSLATMAAAGFKLGFGLTSLVTVWTTAVLRDGALFAKDTEQAKDELASGTCSSHMPSRMLLTAHQLSRGSGASTANHYLALGMPSSPPARV